MNVHDSEKISGLLDREGLVAADNPRDADVIILNTCSIRAKAEEKFFSMLGRMASIKKRRRGLKIGVTGCVAQQDGEAILKRAPYVDFVIGPQNIHLIGRALKTESVTLGLDDNPFVATLNLPAKRAPGVKAWVNIMYGCNNFCSYCVVPYTRGPERSRPAEDVLAEVRQLAGEGVREVTLLGQNVNSYLTSHSFPQLLAEVAGLDGITRVRFVTSHPKDLSDDLIHVMRDSEAVCEHLHLPLQSGSTRILQLMNRRYSYKQYFERVRRLREILPDISITSDIIAGFPQESNDDHRATLEALSEICFDGIFAFKYSLRPRTKAAELPGHLPESLQAERLAEILQLQDRITETKNHSLEGSLQEVLVEGEAERGPSHLTGRTRTNKVVNLLNHPSIHTGTVLTVRITRGYRHSLEGEPVS